MILRRCIMAASSLIFLAGCLEKEIVDDINIESVEGYDLVEPGVILGTFVIPIYLQDQTIKNEIFAGVAHLNKDLMRQMQKKSGAPIVNGSLEVVMFSKEVANEGMISIMDTLQRDASIGTGLYFAIVDGKVNDLLKQDLGDQGTGVYLVNLLKHNIDHRDVPKTNMHLFLSDYYQEGKDPNLPILKQEGEKVAIIGSAVLKGKKLGAEIPSELLFYFKMLVDKHSDGTLSVKLPNKDEYVTMKSIKSSRKLTVEWENGMPKFQILLKVDGIIREFPGGKIDGKKIEKYQKLFQEDITKKSLALIKDFQEKEVDPIGLGFEAKSRMRGFDFKKWAEQYPKVNVAVSTEVRIVSTGISE